MRTRLSMHGLGAVAAMLVLVLLAALAAAVVRLGWTQQVTFGQDINASRAVQASNAGVQWGFYQARRGIWKDGACNGASQTLDLRTDLGFRVTVSCSTTADPYYEGEDVRADGSLGPATVRLYTVESIACNGSGTTCPDAASVGSPHYVERRRRSLIAQ
ncbi:MSHA biogenesis protein MshP [Aquabacterium lacunae]|uniref:MSHA biogenesis protein MshP n=2 Tax=Aquabacterium lacunae TaxID=2528630 RepID=A0A4Q9GZA9_9BURK|nr:MSHA biogenesis protein MshP [Aquabacterium lacunae]